MLDISLKRGKNAGSTKAMVAVTSFSIRCKLSPTVAEVIKIDKLQAQFKECQPPYLNTYFSDFFWCFVRHGGFFGGDFER